MFVFSPDYYSGSMQYPEFHVPHLRRPRGNRRVSTMQKTLDYLTGAYKANDQIYLSGEQMAARPFVASQAKANGMADGDEYLKVRQTRAK